MITVQQGSTSPYVDLLQLALSRYGLPIAVDGVFGPATDRFLREFQRAIGLPADGIAGQRTWAALHPYITGYAVYTVRPGDTLWTIAHRFGTSVEALRVANPQLVPQSLQVAAIINVPLGFAVVPLNVRYTSELTALLIEGLTARYPFIHRFPIGRSVLGRDILAVELGEGASRVGYNASHHANEWVTTPILLRYIEDYAAAVTGGGSIGGENAGRLYRNVTLTAVPLVNPDGMDLVTGAISSGTVYNSAAAIARNYPDIPFPDGWKANIRGTDLNLNYPAGWEIARDIKFAQGFVSPAPRDFVGIAPLSEPESYAMAELTRRSDFQLTLSYHTQGEVIYWKYLDYNPENSYEIALRMGAASGYTVEETPYESGHAGYKDWFIQDWNRPGYTIEAGSGTSPLPVENMPNIYLDNIGIMTIGMDAVIG